MIYVSSSCIKTNSIVESIEKLASYGIKNIELSGGTNYYDNLKHDLLNLKSKYKLSYLCHNYFPPPKEHFILNLASLDEDIYMKSLEHFKKSIQLSKSLGSKRFGLHAGFFIDIKINEIGKDISYTKIHNKEIVIKRFCEAFNILKEQAKTCGVELYIENNVYSFNNAKTYNNKNIFMMTSFPDYEELRKEIEFELLLDVAHLKVSSNTLKLNFEEQLKKFIKKTDYIHISDNNALADENNKLILDSDLMALLRTLNIKNKTFTLEVYDNMDVILESIRILKGAIND